MDTARGNGLRIIAGMMARGIWTRKCTEEQARSVWGIRTRVPYYTHSHGDNVRCNGHMVMEEGQRLGDSGTLPGRV